MKTLPFAAIWMELEIIMLSEVSQAEKDNIYHITYMWAKKYIQVQLILQNSRLISRNQTHSFKRERERGRINLDYGINRYTPIYKINNKGLLYNCRNYIAYVSIL